MNKSDAIAWARGVETQAKPKEIDKKLASAMLSDDHMTVESLFIYAGHHGANADTGHKLRSAWEMARAYMGL